MKKISEQGTSPHRAVPCCYFDKVAIWIHRPPDRSERQYLQLTCDSVHIQVKTAGWDHRLRCRLDLKRPSSEAIEFLKRITDTFPVCVNEVEAAYELIVTTQQAATQIGEWINIHLLRRRRGQHPVRRNQNTRYTGKAWDCGEYVTYSDRPSKTTGRPCARLEWRAHGARHVRRMGIAALDGLLHFDHQEFWTRQRRFILRVDVAALGRQVLRRAKAKRPRALWFRPGIGYRDLDVHAGTLIVRAAAQTEEPEVQDIYDFCLERRIKTKTALLPYPPSIFLHQIWDIAQPLIPPPPHLRIRPPAIAEIKRMAAEKRKNRRTRRGEEGLP